MIEFMSESDGKVLGIKATGNLTDADYKQILIPKLNALFGKFGKLNILLYMGDQFEGWDLEAAWDDAAVGLKHRSDIEKMALVGAPVWVEWCVKFCGFLMSGEIRFFDVDQLKEAWTWVRS